MSTLRGRVSGLRARRTAHATRWFASARCCGALADKFELERVRGAASAFDLMSRPAPKGEMDGVL